MNNYVNKENAIGLKEIGFDGAVNACYAEWVKEDVVKVNPAPSNWNQYCDAYSAPSFLQAADWLFENHSMEFTFRPNRTRIFDWQTEEMHKFSEVHGDHRNAAIAHAIAIVKERREKGGAQ